MEKDLRLRLVVRRHGVPDVKLLWNATVNEDLTISRLLAQVNEVIPLESGDWGLEDYAAELKDASGDAFECVHYHLVSKLFKDDDQVLIRPLLTDDLKRRRLSGRHQISADGRHLVDGLAFGRPWLRAPRDRPAVTLPPRKKARIAYSSDDEHDTPSESDKELPMLEFASTRAQEDPSSVRLRARFYDAESDSNREEDDEDFEPASDGDDEDADPEDEDMQEELRLIREDNAAVREGDILEELRNIRDKRVSSGTGSSRRSLEESDDSPVPSASNALVRSGGRSSRAHLDLDSLDKIGALRIAFPGAPISAIEQALLKCARDPANAYRKLRKTFVARLNLQQTLDRQARSLSSSPIRHTNLKPGRELVLRETSPSERASHATTRDSDDDDEEVSTIVKRNTHANHGPRRSDESSLSDSDSSFESSSEESSESDRQTNEPSDDDSGASSDDDGSSESEDGGPVLDAENSGQEISSSDDDSDSDDSGSDDSSVVATKGRILAKNAAASNASSDLSSESSSSSEDSSSEDSSSDSEPEEIPTKTLSNQYKSLEPPKVPQAAAAPASQAQPVPPGQGLSKTQKRNARRKLAKQMTAQPHPASGQRDREPSGSAVTKIADDQAAFLARKQALLDAILSETTYEPVGQEKSQGVSDSAPQDMDVDSTPDAMETSQSPAAQGEDTAVQRRMKPNVGAARRMLMGSLGLKNPKTKADEDKIRQDLMKGVRPHTNARLTEAASQAEESAQAQELVEEDPEAWREKIAYRAVECCHEGIELSEPPFPFVQRWDPQQQVEEWFGSKNKRGGKRKRVQRNQAQYYEDGDSQASKKRRVTGESVGEIFSDALESFLEEGDTTLNYDDPPDTPLVAKAGAGESQATDIDDLPSLPSDLTSLADLGPGEAKIGMVITWKQLLLSPATNWQPEVVNLTGILVRVHDEDASDLEFLLAQRDRNLEHAEKKYDEDTGERVYDRFEAPDDDEDADDEEQDEGYRRLNYTELIEPKIVQQPFQSGDKEKASGNKDSSAAPADSVVHETVYDGQSEPSQVNGDAASQSEVGEDGSQSKFDAKDNQAMTNADFGQPQVVADSDPRLDAASGHDEPDPHSEIEGDTPDDHVDQDTPTSQQHTDAKDAQLVSMTEQPDSHDMRSSPDETALSISSDRRHEISIMIEEAGFRKDVSPSIIRRKTSSPSRQLLEMSEAANTSRVFSKSPLSQESMIKDTTPVPGKSDDAAGASVDTSAAPPSSLSSVHSGRQPDVDFGFDMAGDDLPRISDTGDGSPLLGASTPKAELQTPTEAKEPSEPSSTTSFPSLEELFQTATSQRDTQSPSKSQLLSTVDSRKSIVQRDEEYEAAMRKIDEEEEEEDDGDKDEEDESPQERKITRKKLFVSSSQPTPASISESPDMPDIKPVAKSAPSSFAEAQGVEPLPRTRKQKGSPFVVPVGSKVIALSSSPSVSPDRELKEVYAEDDIDDDYQENSSSRPRGSGSAKKNKTSKVNSRAKSMPAARTTTRSASAKRSTPQSSQPAKPSAKARGQRKSSTRF